jgi:hypothetical protein
MRLLLGVPWPLVVVPVVLMGLDVTYKWGFFKEAPTDSVADIALAGLTFGAVHLLTTMLREGPTAHPIPAEAFVWVLLQFGAWPLCLLWSGQLKKSHSSPFRLLSYLVGGAWFVYIKGRILTLVP